MKAFYSVGESLDKQTGTEIVPLEARFKKLSEIASGADHEANPRFHRSLLFYAGLREFRQICEENLLHRSQSFPQTRTNEPAGRLFDGKVLWVGLLKCIIIV